MRHFGTTTGLSASSFRSSGDVTANAPWTVCTSSSGETLTRGPTPRYVASASRPEGIFTRSKPPVIAVTPT